MPWNKITKSETGEFESPAQEELYNKLKTLSKDKQDSLAKQIRQLVQHGTIRKVDAESIPFKIESKSAHFNKYTKISLSATDKPMHADDPERDKREELKAQLINGSIDSAKKVKPVKNFRKQ